MRYSFFCLSDALSNLFKTFTLNDPCTCLNCIVSDFFLLQLTTVAVITFFLFWEISIFGAVSGTCLLPFPALMDENH